MTWLQLLFQQIYLVSSYFPAQFSILIAVIQWILSYSFEEFKMQSHNDLTLITTFSFTEYGYWTPLWGPFSEGTSPFSWKVWSSEDFLQIIKKFKCETLIGKWSKKFEICPRHLRTVLQCIKFSLLLWNMILSNYMLQRDDR